MRKLFRSCFQMRMRFTKIVTHFTLNALTNSLCTSFFCVTFTRLCMHMCYPKYRAHLFYRIFIMLCSQVQYRMHPEIRFFPSARFYEGALADGPGTAVRRSNLVQNTVISSSTSSTLATVSLAVAPPEWVSAVSSSTPSTTNTSTARLNADATPSISLTAVASAPRGFVDLPPHPLFPPLLMLDLGSQRYCTISLIFQKHKLLAFLRVFFNTCAIFVFNYPPRVIF